MPRQDEQGIRNGDRLRQGGRWREAMDAYECAIASQEVPDADVCLKIARCRYQLGEHTQACRWLWSVVDAGEDFMAWQAAGALLTQVLNEHTPATRRSVKLAVLGSYTTTQFVSTLRLATMRQGIALEIYECPYGQYRQEILNPDSPLYRFGPEVVVLATHAGDLALPEFSETPHQAIEAEVTRWTSLWQTLAERCDARIVQHNFAVPVMTALGHLAARTPGALHTMTHALNAALGEAAGNAVSIVDCERLAGQFGKAGWFDDRYWFMSKQAVALDALPLLANHTVAVLAAVLGLSRKCLVMDLDNTLWGGVIGEDGLAGITLGAGPVGEAYLALQEFILSLKNKGVILAVCSKNNEADARQPFENHPDMRIGLDDLAMFVANWKPKPDNLQHIAKTLNIGLDSLVFLDDSPAEREAVRRLLPEVEVITLGDDPMQYRRALADYLMFETSSLTDEDANRTEQYKARAQIATLESSATTLEDFYRSLQMKAVIAPFDEFHLSRIVQLIGKTNQFNLTTRRHSLEQVRTFMADPSCEHFYLKLSDRFTDHGLVSLLIAHKAGGTLDIDTWLMSCRVIGRTVEAQMMQYLCVVAQAQHCTRLCGTYIPTAKNGLVADVFGKLGFQALGEASVSGAVTWEYDLAAAGPISNEVIDIDYDSAGGRSDAA